MRQRGFTLIEMLMALMIGSIVALSLTLITRAMTQTAQNEQMNVEASMAARAGLDMLRLDMMRTGMFYAANTRADQNVNSMVTATGDGGGTHRAYWRSPIVHLNSGAGGSDMLVLVGNFIGDSYYEAEVDMDAGEQIIITSNIQEGMCAKEFNEDYAFVHIVNAQGQTHEVQVESVNTGSQSCSGGVCTGCVLNIVQGELIAGAFGERHVKIAANQAALYRVETVDGRNVLLRYLINYQGDSEGAITTSNATGFVTAEAAATAVVVAENVADFQVWFRSINPSSTTIGDQQADLPLYHPLATLAGAKEATVPIPENELIGVSAPASALTNKHLLSPESSTLTQPLISPEHVRSVMISLAIRTEKTDQFQGQDTDAGEVVRDELAPPPGGDIGHYKLKRFTVEVKLPNIMSQMDLFQYDGSPVL